MMIGRWQIPWGEDAQGREFERTKFQFQVVSIQRGATLMGQRRSSTDFETEELGPLEIRMDDVSAERATKDGVMIGNCFQF
jgi:hypothetical protein